LPDLLLSSVRQVFCGFALVRRELLGGHKLFGECLLVLREPFK